MAKLRGRTAYPHPCYHPTCSKPTYTPYCELHTVEHRIAEREAERIRQSKRLPSSQRGYGGSWRAIRDTYLATHPMCEGRGCLHRAVLVDHITPIRRGGTHHTSNLQALCNPCHMSKTRREQAEDRRRA